MLIKLGYKQTHKHTEEHNKRVLKKNRIIVYISHKMTCIPNLIVFNICLSINILFSIPHNNKSNIIKYQLMLPLYLPYIFTRMNTVL